MAAGQPFTLQQARAAEPLSRRPGRVYTGQALARREAWAAQMAPHMARVRKLVRGE